VPARRAVLGAINHRKGGELIMTEARPSQASISEGIVQWSNTRRIGAWTVMAADTT
jgi:hypothetical protein